MTETRNHEQEEKVIIAGASSSACLDFAQIPFEALRVLGERYALGQIKHGRHNWRKGLHNKEYVLARASHLIQHAFKLANQLDGTMPWDEDDNIGAILWGGAFMAEARRLHPEFFQPEPVVVKASEADKDTKLRVEGYLKYFEDKAKVYGTAEKDFHVNGRD